MIIPSPLYLITSLIAIYTTILLGPFILKKSPKAYLNRVFCLWTLTVAMITIGDFMRKTTDDPNSALFWAKFMMIGAILLMPTFLHFTLLLKPESEIVQKKRILYLLYTPSLIFLALLPTDLLVSGVTQVGWRFSVVSGPANNIFSLVLGAFLVAGAITSIMKVRKIRPINYCFAVLGICIAAGLATNFLPLLQTLDIPTISPLAMVSSSIFAYVVIKHKFLVIPMPESAIETKLKYTLEAGYSYLVKTEKPEESFSIFVDLVTHGHPGICITRNSPDKIREKYNLRKTPIFWLTQMAGEYNILDVQHLAHVIASFLDVGDENKVILLHGLEYLIIQNGFVPTLKALQIVNDYIKKNGAYMIIPISPLTMDTQQLKLLEAETHTIAR